MYSNNHIDKMKNESNSINKYNSCNFNMEFDFKEFNYFKDECIDNLDNNYNKNTEVSKNKNDIFCIQENDNNCIKKKNLLRYCHSCNIEAVEDIGPIIKLICPKCGVEFQNINDKSVNFNTSIQYNTSKYNSVTTKIEGKDSYAHNKSLRGVCFNYNVWNSKRAVKYLNRCSYESETDKIPPYINEIVIAEFEKIRRRKTFRGPVQVGIKAVLAYYICPLENLARKPSEMAKLHNIKEKDLSKADSIVREFIEEGVIDLQVNLNRYDGFIERYMALLDIDAKWKDIIVDIIERAEKKHLYVKKNPKLSTKCMGAIYLIINSVPTLKSRISKDEISTKCNISKTTFISQYHLLLNNNKKLKKVFKKYNLRFPKV